MQKEAHTNRLVEIILLNGAVMGSFYYIYGLREKWREDRWAKSWGYYWANL